MARITVSAIAVLLALLAIGMTTASGDPGNVAADRAAAEAGTKTVPAERVIISERDPSAPNDRCFAAAFYEFRDVPGATSATLTFTQRGAEQSVGESPPYDDGYVLYGKTLTPAAGHHRIGTDVFGSAAGAGSGGHCDANVVPAIEAGTSSTGTVELTGEFEDSCPSPSTARMLTRSRLPIGDFCDTLLYCAKQKLKLKEWQKKVARLSALIVMETEDRETISRLEAKLRRAKSKRDVLRDVIKELC